MRFGGSLDGMVEDVVKSCSKCQQAQLLQTSAPMQPWSWPTIHWSVDFAGPLDGRMFLIVVNRRPFKVVKSHSNENCNSTHNSPETADTILKI